MPLLRPSPPTQGEGGVLDEPSQALSVAQTRGLHAEGLEVMPSKLA